MSARSLCITVRTSRKFSRYRCKKQHKMSKSHFFVRYRITEKVT
ncbi:hypothetical protein RLOC_00004409 [Lonchura striata]|uniref:Uncharacterized protein n=1 Tax=Lonchura striata TaxID=40157 RepID=A0A218UKI5_9PASE|nr:hypothetical protein RLOC_00004409 [Lonchura striata domestica]